MPRRPRRPEEVQPSGPHGPDGGAKPWLAGPGVEVYLNPDHSLTAVRGGQHHVFQPKQDAAHYWHNDKGFVKLKLVIGGGLYGVVVFGSGKLVHVEEQVPRTWT